MYKFRTLLAGFGTFVFIGLLVATTFWWSERDVGIPINSIEIQSSPIPTKLVDVLGVQLIVSPTAWPTVTPASEPTPKSTPAFPSLTPTAVPTRLPTNKIEKNNQSTNEFSEQQLTPTSVVTSTIAPIDTVTEAPTISYSPTPTVLVLAATTLPTELVTLIIQTPDSYETFSITVETSQDACSILEKARDQGKLSSLTIDDSYLSMMNSVYVYEINGWRNNWTFTVNGESPLGCSLVDVHPNDTVIWKFS